MKKFLISISFLVLLFGCKADGMNTIKNSLQKTDDYFKSLSEGTCDDCLLQKADNFFKEVNEGSRKSNQSQNTKTYDMGHGQKLTVDISKSTPSNSSNVVKVSEKKEVKEGKEELGFWGKTDKFLKQGANLISKKDKITGLRSLNTTSDKQAKKRGIQSLNWFVAEAKKQNAKVYKSGEPEYERVKYILDRVVQGSHYRNEPDIRFEVINSKMVNAYAFGGGNFLVFTGLMNKATDDELAFVIAHELAHNSASHNEEKAHYMRMKDVFGKKPTNVQRTIFSNIMEQEADRIGIVYTALAGFDPCASATYWKKQFQGVEQYAYFRTHPANPQRASANSQMCAVVKKYYTRGQVNPNVEKILQCNELFCNKSGKELEGGKGGGVVAVIEVLADTIQKNKQAKEEQRKQEIEIAQANKLLAQKRLLTPPNIGWDNTVAFRYQGKVNRHNQISGNSFGFSRDLSRGKFYYNFNNQLVEANMSLHSQNQNGYWFRWQDNWGQGFVNLKEYTDKSMRGNIYIDDGTNPGKLIGEFNGFRK